MSTSAAGTGLLRSALGRRGRGARRGRARGGRARRGCLLENLGEGGQLLAGGGEVALALGLLVRLEVLQGLLGEALGRAARTRGGGGARRGAGGGGNRPRGRRRLSSHEQRERVRQRRAERHLGGRRGDHVFQQ